MALCERTLEPPLQSDPQLRPSLRDGADARERRADAHWATRNPRRSEVILFLWFLSQTGAWCSCSQGQQSVQKEEGKKGGFHHQICVHMQFEHASECFFLRGSEFPG